MTYKLIGDQQMEFIRQLITNEANTAIEKRIKLTAEHWNVSSFLINDEQVDLVSAMLALVRGDIPVTLFGYNLALVNYMVTITGDLIHTLDEHRISVLGYFLQSLSYVTKTIEAVSTAYLGIHSAHVFFPGTLTGPSPTVEYKFDLADNRRGPEHRLPFTVVRIISTIVKMVTATGAEDREIYENPESCDLRYAVKTLNDIFKNNGGQSISVVYRNIEDDRMLYWVVRLDGLYMTYDVGKEEMTFKLNLKCPHARHVLSRIDPTHPDGLE